MRLRTALSSASPHVSRLLLVSALVAGQVGQSSLAWGQELSPKAEVLFSEGLKLAQGGDCPAAREKFVESYAADPAPGTLINWALCEEKLGRPAAALDLLKVAAQKLTPSHPKHAGVAKHIDALIKRVPFLRLRVSSDWPQGTVVLKDGVVVDPGALAQTQPQDPGAHIIEVKAPGRQDRRYEVSLMEGRTLEVTLEPGPKASSDAAPGSPEATPDRAKSEERLMGFVIAGGGLAAVIAGTITGLMAKARLSDMEADPCDMQAKTCETQAGVNASHAGSTLATISTASFVTGAVALGLGGYFIFKDGPQKAATVPQPVVVAGPHELGLRLRGSF